MPDTTRPKGIAIAVTGVIVLTPDALLMRLISVDTATLLFWRGALMSISLLSYLLFFKRVGISFLLRSIPFCLKSGILLSGATLFFVFSVTATKVANTLFILSTMPLIAAFFSRIAYGCSIPKATWFVILSCIAGLGIMTTRDTETAFWGNIAALGAACCHAGNFTFLRKGKDSNVTLSVALSGLMIAAGALFFSHPFSVSHDDIIYLLILGGVLLPISFGLLTYAPQFISSTDVSLIMLLEVVLSPLLVWALIGEKISLNGLIGGAIVLFSILVYIFYVAMYKKSHPDI